MRSMKDETGELLEELAVAVQESAKYRHVSPDLIRRLGGCELAKRRSLKEAIKETKNTLHQIAGAYLDSTPRYDRRLAELRAAANSEEIRTVCRTMMGEHASTRERLPYLDAFYSTALADIPAVHSVLDVACGLNPLALPWMPFAQNPRIRYTASDLYADMMDFLNDFFLCLGVEGRAEVQDSALPPPSTADVALVLKFLPVLEQTEKGTAGAWLRGLNTRYVLVSFPTKSLSGRGKGMAEYYEGWFRELMQSESWTFQRCLFPNELCFLIEKE